MSAVLRDHLDATLKSRIKDEDGAVSNYIAIYNNWTKRTAAEVTAGVTPTDYAFPPGDVRRYGATSGSGNCVTAFTNALLSNYSVYVPPGDWRLDTMIQIEQSCSVFVDQAAVITRYSAFSSDTTPVFWLHGSFATLSGKGSFSIVKTQNRAPDGIVLIGHASMAVSHGEVDDCTVRNLRLTGQTSGGQTSGNPDGGLKIINPQLGGLASYFHRISGLTIEYTNNGLWLQGWANAIRVNGLQIERCGNSTLKSAAIYCQGALDNTVAQIFHHQSPDSVSLRIEDYDNTATPGGILHVSQYNSFDSIQCEQGGASALAIVANANCTAFRNYIQVVDNVAGGIDLSTAFANINSIILSTGFLPEYLTVRKDAVVGGTTTLSGSLSVGLSVQPVVAATTGITSGAGVAAGAAVTIIPATALTIQKATMVLVNIFNTSTNNNLCRSDLLLLNLRNSAHSASTVTVVSSSITLTGGNGDPTAATYTLSFAAGAGLPALQVSITSVGGPQTFTAEATLIKV